MSYQLPGTGNSHNLGNVFENNSTYTVQSDDYAVICTNPAIIIITLPAPASYPDRLLVIKRAPASEVQKVAMSEGMITMRQDGYLKALTGITTIEEVNRVAADTA